METDDKATPAKKKKVGRPEGSMNKLAREAREQARLTGKLPHEIMLEIARGEVQYEKHIDLDTGEITKKPVVVPIEMRLDAAKAAAPYYAPKISTVEVIQGVTDEDLDSIIASLAAEAGVSLGADGEGEAGEGTQGEGGTASDDVSESELEQRAAGIRRRPVTGTRSGA